MSKRCVECQSILNKRNKSGICHPCSKLEKWTSGTKINNIEFLKYLKRDNKGYQIWEFKCHCENLFSTQSFRIKSGRTKSCGCLNVEHCKSLGKTQRNEKSPVWIKDRTKTSLFLRKRDFLRNNKGSWQYVSRKYKKEQNYYCALTGVQILEKNGLHVHHIESVTNKPELILNKENLVCIKRELHIFFHKKYGKKTNRQDWEEFRNEFRDSCKKLS